MAQKVGFDCARGTSHIEALKLVLSDLRYNLSEDNLAAIMMVKLNANNIELA